MLDLDKPYDYKPIDLYNPPPINRHKVAEAIRQCSTFSTNVENAHKVENDHVDIKVIAVQYKQYFEKFV